jgi:hypothetical protein
MQCQSSTHGTCTHAPAHNICEGPCWPAPGPVASVRLIHVRHEVDKVVRVGVVVGVGLRVVLRVPVHLAIGHRSDVSRTAWRREMLAPLRTQILRSTRDPWDIPLRIILVHEQDEIDLKRMRSDVMSKSPHKTPPHGAQHVGSAHACPPLPTHGGRILHLVRGIKKTQASGPLAVFLHFLSSFAQGASVFSTLFSYGSSPIASEFLTVPVPFGVLVPNFLSSVYLYRIFLDRFS